MATIHKYLHNGSVYTLDELHSLGILLGETPTKTTVYGLGAFSGQTGTRYVGSGGDVMVMTSSESLVYYATQAACDADWSTEEPATIMYLNSSSDLSTNATIYKGGLITLYVGGKSQTYDSSKTYTITDRAYGGCWGYSSAGLYITGQSSTLKIGYSGSNSSTTLSAVKVQIT